MLLGEVFANDANQMHGSGEIRAGDTGERGRATEEIFAFGCGGFDVIDGDGASDEDWGVGDGHGCFYVGDLIFQTQNKNLISTGRRRLRVR
jgi:hypothetical protein